MCFWGGQVREAFGPPGGHLLGFGGGEGWVEFHEDAVFEDGGLVEGDYLGDDVGGGGLEEGDDWVILGGGHIVGGGFMAVSICFGIEVIVLVVNVDSGSCIVWKNCLEMVPVLQTWAHDKFLE